MDSPTRMLIPWDRDENSIHFLSLNVAVDNSDKFEGRLPGSRKRVAESARDRLVLGTVSGGQTGVDSKVLCVGQGLESISREYSDAVE
jgi:hypothetical protein